MTADQKQIKAWRKYQRQSRIALRIGVPMLVVECLVLYIISLFVGWPTWLVVVGAIAIGVGAFTIICDAVNMSYLRRKLRGADGVAKPGGRDD